MISPWGDFILLSLSLFKLADFDESLTLNLSDSILASLMTSLDISVISGFFFMMMTFDSSLSSDTLQSDPLYLTGAGFF